MLTGNAFEAVPTCEITTVELPTGTSAGTSISSSTATLLTIQETLTSPGLPPTVTDQLRAASTGQVPKICAPPLGQMTGLPRASATKAITGACPQAADPARTTAPIHR